MELPRRVRSTISPSKVCVPVLAISEVEAMWTTMSVSGLVWQARM